MRSTAGLVLLAGVATASVQWPLTPPSFQEVESDVYQFAWPIQRVAVIGAGPRFNLVLSPSTAQSVTHPHFLVAVSSPTEN